MEYVNVNGQVQRHSEATLHISDLGLRRGYGAFEFFRILRGIPVFLEDHLNRLENTARLMDLEIPYSRAQLEGFIRELIGLNRLEQAGLQMVLTGGYSEDIFTPGRPNLILAPIEVKKQPERLYTEGAKIILHTNVREMAHAKSTDYLVAVKLGKRMRAEGASEVVYHDGFMVSEGARSSLSIVRNGTLVTARNGVLPGITRMHMLRVAEGILPVEYRDIELEELYAADEVILTGATREVMPVTQIEDQRIGEVGPFSKAIMRAFAAHVEAYLESRSVST